MLQKIVDWFTPVRRRAIYVLGVALGSAMLAFGVITADNVSQAVTGLEQISGLILALTNLMAALNVNAN